MRDEINKGRRDVGSDRCLTSAAGEVLEKSWSLNERLAAKAEAIKAEYPEEGTTPALGRRSTSRRGTSSSRSISSGRWYRWTIN